MQFVIPAQALQGVVAGPRVDGVCPISALEHLAGIGAGAGAGRQGGQVPHGAVSKLHLLQRVAVVARVVAAEEAFRPQAIARARNGQQQRRAITADLHVGSGHAVFEAQGVELARCGVFLGLEGVLPITTPKQVGVVAQAPLQRVIARAAVQHVIARIAVQGIAVCTAKELVGTFACAQGVLPVFAVQFVITF